HFDSGACRSCTLLDLPRPRQLAEGRERVEHLVAPFLALGTQWGPPIVGPEAGFRARGKMAVGGTAQEPVLTLPGQSAGTDLCDCPLYPPGVEAVLDGAKALIRRAQVPPYDVARRRGEIKNVLVTASPDGQHLLRLVLRSEKALGRIREHLPALLEAHPSVVAVTANLHPDHTTAVEGAQEIHLAGSSSIAIRTGDVTLFSRPQSFLQTTTEVAGAVPHARLTGVEVSAQAIEGAREAATAAGIDNADFLTGDATAWAAAEADGPEGPPDAVVVNPPRRGLGGELAGWLERCGVRDVIYSSCNPTTLAADLAAMPSLRVVAGRYVDMFPHTAHAEVIVRLRRG